MVHVAGVDLEVAANLFFDVIMKLETDPVVDSANMRDGVRFISFGAGRDGAAFTHEFFPVERDAGAMIELAREIAGEGPHLLDTIGYGSAADASIYTAAGYTKYATWTLMAMPLAGPYARPGDGPTLIVSDPATEARVLTGVLASGEQDHPERGGFVGDPAIRQRWIEIDGDVAAFGRTVMLGDVVYLGGMATVPAFRRRGLAGDLMRALLDDARAARAKHCFLVSTEMARQMYVSTGFTELGPVGGWQTRPT